MIMRTTFIGPLVTAPAVFARPFARKKLGRVE